MVRRSHLYQFETHTKLHLSQTGEDEKLYQERFETHTKLHLSQTRAGAKIRDASLRPILNYISLKLQVSFFDQKMV